jgi:diadenosine tetraphosphate (Ap4A) HIT family hydrolase
MTCCICSQIVGDASNDLLAKAIGGDAYVRRVAMETVHFAVIPSLGGLVPGHVILCPKEHYLSFASLPSCLDDECEHLILDLKRLLREIYSTDVHMFEHGMATKGSRVLCTVEHAHLHLLPAPVSITNTLDAYPNLAVGKGLAGLRNLVDMEEYVFYESPQEDRRLIRARDQLFESQYLRRVFAEALGHASDWNWRDRMKAADAHETFEKLAASAAGIYA